MRTPMFLLALVAAMVLCLAPAASANHDKGGAKTYTLDGKLKKLSGRMAIGFMAQDLGKRLGTKIDSVKAGNCKGASKKKKSCSYVAQDAMSKALGTSTLWCAKGSIKLVRGGTAVKIKQSAKQC